MDRKPLTSEELEYQNELIDREFLEGLRQLEIQQARKLIVQEMLDDIVASEVLDIV